VCALASSGSRWDSLAGCWEFSSSALGSIKRQGVCSQTDWLTDRRWLLKDADTWKLWLFQGRIPLLNKFRKWMTLITGQINRKKSLPLWFRLIYVIQLCTMLSPFCVCLVVELFSVIIYLQMGSYKKAVVACYHGLTLNFTWRDWGKPLTSQMRVTSSPVDCASLCYTILGPVSNHTPFHCRPIQTARYFSWILCSSYDVNCD
jgi:hypothetical protein